MKRAQKGVFIVGLIHDLPETPTLAIKWFEELPAGAVIENLTAWRQTIDHIDNPIHRTFYELLLFTGLRKTEALTPEWVLVHEDRIHPPMTKMGRSFDLPILELHHDNLVPVRGLHEKWELPSPQGPDSRLSSPRRLERSPNVHRRTFATIAFEAGVLKEIVGRLPNPRRFQSPGRDMRCHLTGCTQASDGDCLR